VRAYRTLRSFHWWRYLGLVWAFLLIVLPGVSYAMK
jgi:hypothetical protein